MVAADLSLARTQAGDVGRVTCHPRLVEQAELVTGQLGRRSQFELL